MRRTEITPELVLVDPELRRHVLRQPSRADPAGWARFPSPHLHPPAPSPARRRPVSPWGRRRRAVLTVTAFALVAGTAFAIGLATGFDATVRTTAAVATTTTEGQRDAPRAGAAVPAIGAWAGAGAALTSRVVSPGAGPPATAERPRPRASPKPQPRPTDTSGAVSPATGPGALTARRLAWAPVPGARSYIVQLVRRGSVVFSRATRGATVEVPRSLKSGRYLWYVWPVTAGTRAERAAVRSTISFGPLPAPS